MKNISFRKLSFGILPLIVFAITLLSSCDKDSEEKPIIDKVYLLDTIARHKDSILIGGDPSTLVVINGRNLGGVIKVYFNEYETSFNTNYNTATNLIIRVPAEAPTDSTANNLIRVVTVNGEATYNFKIIAKPSIISVNKLNYGDDGGRDITFKGKNFADMVSVIAFREKDFPTEKVTDSVICQIMSKTAEKLVVRIPNNTLSRVTLNFTNSSGTTYGTDVFVNADVAYKFFTESLGVFSSPDDSKQGEWAADSWGKPVSISSEAASAYSGGKSLSILVTDWTWFGLSGWWPRYYYDTQYKYVTFAIKGGDKTMDLWMMTSATTADFKTSDKNKIEVQAKIWNYYKIALADVDLLKDGSIIQQIGFKSKELNKDTKDAQLYIDDLMLIK